MTDEDSGSNEKTSDDQFKELIATKIRVALQALKDESDRGMVLVGAAILDEQLEALLCARLCLVTTSKDPLFNFGAPLGSFSGRIQMTHRVGSVSRPFARQIDLIRRIRNKFAHNGFEANLTDTGTINQIEDLFRGFTDLPGYLPGRIDPTPRNKFLAAVAVLYAELAVRTEQCERIPEEVGVSTVKGN